MQYAVIKTGGKQYKVSEGSEIEVDKIDGELGTEIKFDNVLLVADGDVFQVGQPQVEGVHVQAKVMEHKKGKKIRVAKFKAKARYRKVTGHRQHLTKLQITKISVIGSKKSEVKPLKVTKQRAQASI